MRVTTKGRYGVRAVTQLAQSYDGKPLSIRELAAKEEISPEFLEQIFFRLRKAGIINSTRGPGGGFALNRNAKDISFADIFLAVEEGLDITPCTNIDDQDHCRNDHQCIAHNIWTDIAAHIVEYFESISIQDVLDKNKDI